MNAVAAGMGSVKVRAKVWNIENPELSREVELLAGTGAIYTVLPSSLLKELNIRAIGKRKFKLANNRVVERDVGLMGIEVEGRFTHTVVVFGEEGVYLLGVTTLEELGFRGRSREGGSSAYGVAPDVRQKVLNRVLHRW